MSNTQSCRAMTATRASKRGILAVAALALTHPIGACGSDKPSGGGGGAQPGV